MISTKQKRFDFIISLIIYTCIYLVIGIPIYKSYYRKQAVSKEKEVSNEKIIKNKNIFN